MDIKQNVRAILDSNLTEIKDEIKDRVETGIAELIEANKITEIWVTTRLIPGESSMQLMFFDNEKAAINYCKHYKDHGASYQKYALENAFTPNDSAT